MWNIFKVNNKNTRRRQELRCGGFIVNFEHISHLGLEFLFPRRTELQKLKGLYFVANRFLGRYNDILQRCELTLLRRAGQSFDTKQILKFYQIL